MSDNIGNVDPKALEKGFDGAIAALKEIIKLTSSDNVGSYISLIGIVLLTFSVFSTYRLIQKENREVTIWHKTMTFIMLLLAVVCIICGPTLSLLYYGAHQQQLAQNSAQALSDILHRDVSQKDISGRARKNEYVKYLVRLIPYDPKTEPELSLASVSQALLGPASQKYTFVADYDELKGYSIAEAVKRTGLPIVEGQRVTAIIFPIKTKREVIPANARGLLQILDKTASPADTFRMSALQNLSSGAKKNLTVRGQASTWAFSSYREYYTEFCKASFDFVCNKEKYPISLVMAKVTHDWHPLGVAKHISESQDPCNHPIIIQNYCEITEWPSENDDFVKQIGARIFFTNNSLIKDIDGRMLFDFEDPEKQRLPLIILEEKKKR